FDQTEEVRSTGLGAEVVHLVVQEEAGVASDDLRAEVGIDRIRYGDRVPVAVDDAVMRRALAFVAREASAFHRARRHGAIGRNLAAYAGGIAGVEELGDRIPDEIRVAEVRVPIGVGVPLRLDRDVEALHRVKAPVGERVSLEDAQDLAESDTARARRRRRHDLVATVATMDGRQLGDGIGGEVFPGKQAAVLRRRFGELLRNRSAIERVRSLLRDLLQARREILLYEAVAGR